VKNGKKKKGKRQRHPEGEPGKNHKRGIKSSEVMKRSKQHKNGREGNIETKGVKLDVRGKRGTSREEVGWGSGGVRGQCWRRV